jgi:hypothetical protein
MTKATSLTRPLRNSLKTDFFPFLLERQFKREASSSLFYPFRRINHCHQLVEIQFDKHQKPKFVINFGEVPNEGIIDSYGRNRPAELVSVCELQDSGRLYKSCLGKCWFSPNRWFGLRSLETSIFAETQLLKKLFVQVELWFDNKQKGSNITIDNWSHRAPNYNVQISEVSKADSKNIE